MNHGVFISRIVAAGLVPNTPRGNFHGCFACHFLGFSLSQGFKVVKMFPLTTPPPLSKWCPFSVQGGRGAVHVLQDRAADPVRRHGSEVHPLEEAQRKLCYQGALRMMSGTPCGVGCFVIHTYVRTYFHSDSCFCANIAELNVRIRCLHTHPLSAWISPGESIACLASAFF